MLRQVGLEQETVDRHLPCVFTAASGGQHTLADGEPAARLPGSDELLGDPAEPMEDAAAGGERACAIEDVEAGARRAHRVDGDRLSAVGARLGHGLEDPELVLLRGDVGAAEVEADLADPVRALYRGGDLLRIGAAIYEPRVHTGGHADVVKAV